MIENNFEKISNVVLQSCEYNKIDFFKQRTEELILNQIELYNGKNEDNFLESLNREMVEVENEMKVLKSNIWDSIFSNNKLSLVEIECSSIDIRKHMDVEYFRKTKDRTSILLKTREHYKMLCVKFQELIEDVSHFFESKTTTGVRCDSYCLVPGVCKLQINKPVFNEKNCTSTVPIDETTKKLKNYLEEKLRVTRWDLVESKSVAFDSIFIL